MKPALLVKSALVLVCCSCFAAFETARGATPAAAATLPFDPLPYSQLVSTGRKVFAHYFTPFPLSLDNAGAEQDYYARHYLNPYGEQSRYLDRGGFLRARPLPRAVNLSRNWELDDLRQEVKMAKAIGLDGFAVDILNYQGVHWERTLLLLEAARLEGGGFKIMLMPDMNAALSREPERFVPMIRALAKHPAVQRFYGGELVVAPYHAARQSAQWWRNQIATLNQEGIEIALVPVFQGWQNHLEAFNDFSIGISDWGARNLSAASKTYWTGMAELAHAGGLGWMAPVAPQDVRPKASTYWEAGNSQLYRQQWESAIEGGADWVHLITWNDYSEHTGISPNTATDYGYYDLTAYYVHWFKKGKRPAIKRDAIYGFNRTHSTRAVPDPLLQRIPIQTGIGSAAPKDQVEMLAFLTAPATLEIELAGKVYRRYFERGIRSFPVPLEPGTPIFRIKRNGTVVASVRGKPIRQSIAVQDMQYHGVSSLR